MTTEITTTTTNLPAPPQGVWGTENISTNDILIPRILIMQPGSDFVVKEKAKAGEFIGTLQENKLGSKDSAMKFIPFYVTRSMSKYDASGAKQKFMGSQPMTPELEALPYEEVVNGIKIKNVKNINVFLLIPSEIETGEYLPYVLSFRNTSYGAGKKLMTLFKKLEAFRKPPASRTFELSCAMKENEKGRFYVLDVAQCAGENTQEQQAAAYQWFKTVSSGIGVRVDESAEDVEAHPSSEDVPF